MVAKSNGSVRILIRSREVAVFVHVQYSFGQNTGQNEWCGIGRPQVAMHLQLPHFLVYHNSVDLWQNLCTSRVVCVRCRHKESSCLLT